jgi:hypothetical protein
MEEKMEESNYPSCRICMYIYIDRKIDTVRERGGRGRGGEREED